MKNFDDEGVFRGFVLYFKPSALVWRSVENSQVSLAKLEKRESTDVVQMQGLWILANLAQPKLAVGAFVILEVSGGRVAGSQVDITVVVDSLARIFDIQAKVWDVFLSVIRCVWFMCDEIGPFEWPSHENLYWWCVCLNATRVRWSNWNTLKCLFLRSPLKVFSLALYCAFFLVFKLYSYE